MTDEEILQLTCPALGDDSTIKDYLTLLLHTLLDQGEYFSAKRPFGDSDWRWDLYEPLGMAGLITASWDEDWNPTARRRLMLDCDAEAGDKILLRLVDAL